MSELVEIVVDVHEQDSEIFEAIGYRKLGVCKMASLETGDIILRHKFYTIGIEVKRGSDFSNSLHSGRLLNQLAKLTESFDYPILIIEDWHPYVAPDDDKESIAEKVRLHKMVVRTLNRKICVVETKHLQESVDVIAELVRDLKMKKLNVLRRPITVEEEMSNSMKVLCSFPQVSRSRAEAIIDRYKSVKNALDNLHCWPDLKIGLTEARCESVRRAWEDELDGE